MTPPHGPNADLTAQPATETPALETESLLRIDDLQPAELDAVLASAAAIKGGTANPRLPEATMAMLFEKPSTRTRISFETGMTDLGGHAIFLGPDDIQLGHGEPMRDTARVLGGYADGVMARLFDHGDLETLAAYAETPVINGLTDDAHPCQTLADLLTIREAADDPTVAWIGDGNNVGQSFVVGAAMAGIDVRVATPEAYAMDEAVFERAEAVGARPMVTTDPAEALQGADIVYTDVWVSMGQEAERDARLNAFDDGGFQVNDALISDASLSVMHCLPAHRGEEITNEVMESDRMLAWEQAENRLHAQKALMAALFG
ncbi:MAG: ornithine carbamoyltransferase [uncultured archaeon A07HR60]|nr:MAG: ornithine carbamoyltransferase [uncultured archaeon A07HR60]